MEIETEESLLEQCPTDSPSIYIPETTSDCMEEPIIGNFNPNVEWTWNDNPLDEAYNESEKFKDWADTNQKAFAISKKLEGLNKNTGVHPSGIAISFDMSRLVS